MFVDLDWPTNASSPLSASAELLVIFSQTIFRWLFTAPLTLRRSCQVPLTFLKSQSHNTFIGSMLTSAFSINFLQGSQHICAVSCMARHCKLTLCSVAHQLLSWFPIKSECGRPSCGYSSHLRNKLPLCDTALCFGTVLQKHFKTYLQWRRSVVK